ncbi:MAG: LytTR family DNA-binding domain-containing protein [Bacteroidales bacterium]
MIKCLVVDDEPLARQAIRAYIEKMPELDMVEECENALQAMTSLRGNHVDLIFLDIEMPEIDGIAFLQTSKNTPAVIFTTAYRNYAVEAFELDVIDYLLKPISFDRFVSAINKFYERSKGSEHPQTGSTKDSSDYLNVKADRRTYKIAISEIQYIESLKDYVKIHYANKSIVTHDSLTNLESLLKEHGFLRTHRSFLVARDKIRSFDAESVFLDTRELPISRMYKQSVLAFLEKG